MKRKIETTDNFRSSASQFREAEQVALNICIKETTDIKEIFKHDSPKNVEGDIKQLILKEYNRTDILEFKPSDDDKLSTLQRKFLMKLKLVLLNNDPEVNAPQCEKFIDELAMLLCDVSLLDDGYKLIMRPCNLSLMIDNQMFAANADREGRRDNNQLVWLIQEDKHIRSTSWLHGDVQLACSMIAAAQYNYSYKAYKTIKMFGIKFVADKLYFCSSTITSDYLEDLISGLPIINNMTMIKYQALSLSKPEDRESIFKLIVCMRDEILE